jgi:hypothetical protein
MSGYQRNEVNVTRSVPTGAPIPAQSISMEMMEVEAQLASAVEALFDATQQVYGGFPLDANPAEAERADGFVGVVKRHLQSQRRAPVASSMSA